MDKIIIQGGRKLEGKVSISGAKNSALPIMASAILSSGWNYFTNIPDLKDIQTMGELLRGFGIEVVAKRSGLKIRADKIRDSEASYDLVRTMRASVVVLGPLLARLGKARVSLPGGCAIGARPIDRHLKAFEAMGAEIKVEGGYVEASCKKLKGARIVFDDITVTGTENVMMAAALADGKTIIENAAREPEIPDLADVLNKMGAQITGAGTDVIEIEGVDELTGCDHRIIPDRIEAGTFMIGAAMTEGDVLVQNVVPEHFSALTSKLIECGSKISVNNDSVHVRGARQIKPINISTHPYPGFATDFQAQYMTLMTVADGTSTISENIFENRFMHVGELTRMGANIQLDKNLAIVTGVPKLSGAPVMATDLRASACLVLAGLVASDITEIHRVYHLDRGYEHLEKKFRNLGARVKRGKVKY